MSDTFALRPSSSPGGCMYEMSSSVLPSEMSESCRFGGASYDENSLDLHGTSPEGPANVVSREADGASEGGQGNENGGGDGGAAGGGTHRRRSLIDSLTQREMARIPSECMVCELIAPRARSVSDASTLYATFRHLSGPRTAALMASTCAQTRRGEASPVLGRVVHTTQKAEPGSAAPGPALGVAGAHVNPEH